MVAGVRRSSISVKELLADQPAVRVAAAIAFVLCAIPSATNVGPGPEGYVIVLLALVALTLWALHEGGGRSALSRRESWAVAAFFGWLALCVVRAAGHWDTVLAATLLAVLACSSPWALVRVLSPQRARQALVVVMGAAVVGSAVAAWLVPLVLGHGIHWRPGLPIGGASNNVVGLTLALAGTVAGARMWPEQRMVWRALAVVAGLLIVQSLSRAGWLLALVLIIVVLLSHPRVSSRWGLPVGGVIAVVTLAELIRRRGLSLFIDQARWDNAVTGLDAWSESVGTMIFGLGPARLWPWLSLERGRPGEGMSGPLGHNSPWGHVLYHAHSTYLEALVEYGIIGLVLLLVVLTFVVQRCVREIRRRGDLMLVAVALLLSLPAMLVELYLFRGFVTAFLWWTAVLAVGLSPAGRAGTARSHS